MFRPELNFVLGEPLQSLGRSQEGKDKDLSKMMIKHWANFVKHGDPNGLEEAEWPQFQSSEWQYLEMRGEEDGSVIAEDMRGRVCQFWDEIIPEFLPQAAATVPDSASPRSSRLHDQTCGRVRQKDYFPG